MKQLEMNQMAAIEGGQLPGLGNLGSLLCPLIGPTGLLASLPILGGLLASIRSALGITC